jgi:hypothetical protein
MNFGVGSVASGEPEEMKFDEDDSEIKKKLGKIESMEKLLNIHEEKIE